MARIRLSASLVVFLLILAVAFLGGTFPPLAAAPPPVKTSANNLKFGSQAVGAISAPKTVTLTNNLTVPLGITVIAVDGDFRQANSCGSSLPARGQCVISVTFAPTAVGTRTGSVTIVYDAAGSPEIIPLSGTGVDPVAVSSATLAFSTQTIGTTSASKRVTVTNNQSDLLSITGIQTSSEFGQTNTCPASLGPAASCTISVTFTPVGVGTRTGTLTISHSAVTSPQQVVLTGTGSVSGLMSIAISPMNPTLAPGETQQFTATGRFSNNSIRDITAAASWSSSDGSVVTIDSAGQSGLATALAPGAARISATLNGITGSSDLVVTAPVLTGLEVSPASTAVTIGRVHQFTAAGRYSDGTTRDVTASVTWSTAAPAVASIGNAAGVHGLAAGLAKGETLVQATLDAVTASAVLTVQDLGRVPQFLYAGNQNGSSISGYSIDSISGQLTTVPQSPFDQCVPTAGAVDPLNQFVAFGDCLGSVRLFSIDPGTGTLTPAGTGTVGNVTALRFSPDGARLFVGLLEDRVPVLAVNRANGTLTPIEGSPFPAPAVTQAMSMDPSGRFLFLAHTGGSLSAFAIASSGTLTPLAGSPYTGPSVLRGVHVHSSGRFVYTVGRAPVVNNVVQGTIVGYALDDATGALTPLTGFPIVTSADVGRLAIDPGGRWAYTADGFGGLATYRIDPLTGTFTLVANGSAGSIPQFLAVDPSGQFLFSANGGGATPGNAVSVWTLNQATGVPSSVPGSPFPAGNNPRSLAISGTSAQADATLLSLEVMPSQALLQKETTQQLTAVGTYSDGSTRFLTGSAVWSSSEPTVASVSTTPGSRGQVTALAAGSTTITTAFGGQIGSATITVAPPQLQSISITPSVASIVAGATQQFVASGTFDDGSVSNVTASATWTSSTVAVATISNVDGSRGRATGLTPGATGITATLGSISGTATLTVTSVAATLVSIDIDPVTSRIPVGSRQPFSARGTFNDGSTADVTGIVTWSALDGAVASIVSGGPDAGVATGLSTGDTTVFAMLGPVSASATLKVGNVKPVADAGADLRLETPQTVQLNGGGSHDDDGDPLTYQWRFVSGPAGATPILSDASAVAPTFDADVRGRYSIELIVNDGFADSLPDIVTVTINTPPTADAGPDQTARVTETVRLNGSQSTDLDGDSLQFTWSFAARPAGSAATLSNPNDVMPTFVIDVPGQYLVQLVVNDGSVNSEPDIVQVDTLNSPPVADAGPDQTAVVGATVLLDGTKSSDVDGQPLAYEWSVLSRPGGSSAALNDAATARPTLQLDRAGSYTIQLIVSDGVAASAPDTVVITTTNSAPVANAGPDQRVDIGMTVQLDGSGSSDVDGDPLTFTWSLTSVPEGSTATLSDPAAVSPTFTVTAAGTYIAQLIVNDGHVNSAADTVLITTENPAPVANAGADQHVPVGSLVLLDGTQSADANGDPLTYAWALIERPAGSLASLSDPATPQPTFTADRAGRYVAQLIVNDGTSNSAPDTVAVSTINVPPVADAGPDQLVAPGALVALNGTGSTDADGDALTFAWSLIVKPAGSVATLSTTDACCPTFTADVPGSYVAQVIVNDGKESSAPDTVMIRATRPPIANAGPNQTVAHGATVQLNGAGSSDPDGDVLTYRWTLTVKPEGSLASLSDGFIAAPTFVADVTGEYRVSLTVSDGAYESAPDVVTIVAQVGNTVPVADAGPDQSAVAGRAVQLDGTGSHDADGNPLTYAWTFLSRPTGSSAALSNASTETPSFIPDVDGSYVVQLVVNDGTADSLPDTVTIVTNRPPLANAGVDQDVPVGSTVQLHGSFVDIDGPGPFTCEWIFNTRPTGSSASLGQQGPIACEPESEAFNPTFVADVAGTYELQLVVNDGLVNSASDTVRITTINRVPTANAGADQADVTVGSVVQLDGSASVDPDCTTGPCPPLVFTWTFAARPEGSGATLVNPNSATPQFTVDVAGAYIVTLIVSDGVLTSSADQVTITTVNRPPIADAGIDRIATAGEAISLSGSNSHDPDNDPITYAWSFSSKPAESAAMLQNATGVSPSFTPDVAGEYVVRLTVSDGRLTSAPDDVTVTAAYGDIALALSDTSLIAVGRTAVLRFSLAVPAPAPVTVTLSSDNTGIVTVADPASVLVPAGSRTGQFILNGISVGSTTVRARAAGFVDSVLEITTTDLSITVTPTLNVAYGTTASLPITVGPSVAPAGGITVAVVSDDPETIEVTTPTVTIPAGAFSANATVKGLGIGSAKVVITAHGFASGAAIVTSSGALNVIQSTVEFRPAFPTSVTVQFVSNGVPTAAPASGIQVGLVAADPGCVSVASPQTIPAGLVNATIPLAYGGSATLPCTTTVTASGEGLTPDTVTVSVRPNPAMTMQGLATFPGVGAGLQTGFNPFCCSLAVVLTEANHDGVTVRISSSDPTKVLIARDASTAAAPFIDVPVANGQIVASFAVAALEGATGSVTITATAPRFTDVTGTVAVLPAVLTISSLTSPMTSLAANADFTVSSGILTSAGSFFGQNARAGGSSIPVTVTSSNPSTGVLVTSVGSGASRNVTISAGSGQTPFGVVNGGIAFDPIAAGTTVVTAVSPGLTTAPGGSVTVTVSSTPITMPSLTNFPGVGAGLQTSNNPVCCQLQAVLGGANHGGVTVRIASSNPAVALVARDATSVATEFVDIVVPNGQTNAPFAVAGVEGASGSVTITASAPGFTNATGTVNVAAPSFYLTGLTTPTTSLSANTNFQIAVGIAASNTVFDQAVRAGASPRMFVVTSSNPSAGVLETSAGRDSSQSVAIAAGQTRSPSTVGAGGIAFDPVGGGQTIVTASSAGFVPATGSLSGTVTVTVNAPAITMQGMSNFPGVGAGLQTASNNLCCQFAAVLGGSNHGGVTVHIASSDPAVALVAPNASTPGTAAIDVFVPNGQTNAGFAVVGVEGRTGMVTLTASAPGFTNGTSPLNVLTPAVFLSGLPPGTTSLSANINFTVIIGVQGSSGFQQQGIRAGSPGVPFTITSSNASAGVLTTSAGSAATRTLTFQAGQNQSGSTLASGGIAFDPVGAGVTTVTATADGFVSGTGSISSSVTITVTAPGITMQGLSTFPGVGAGLQTNFNPFCCSLAAVLGGASHGGVMVRISSSNPAVALVAPNNTTAGAPFIDVPVANGQTTAAYSVVGVPGATGTVTLTASAPGFVDGGGSLNVLVPMLYLSGVPPTTTTLSSDSNFTVVVGVAASNSVFEQQVRTGGSTLSATVTSSDGAVGALVTSAGAGTNQVVTIAPGQPRSAQSVASGGIAFDPKAPGSTVVAASIPGFLPASGQLSASVTVTVSAPTINPNTFGTATVVASGLQKSFGATLAVTPPAGTVVRIQSSDPSRALIATTSTGVGAATADIPVSAQTFTYYVQALPDQIGPVTVTLTAPGFTQGSMSVTVVQPAVRISNLPASTTATAASSSFAVTVGIPNQFATDLAEVQEVRGGSSVLATVTNSNATVAQLVTQAGGAQSRTVSIAGGQSSTPGAVGSGGIVFDPLSAGQTIVEAEVPGFIKTGTATRTVIVSP